MPGLALSPRRSVTGPRLAHGTVARNSPTSPGRRSAFRRPPRRPASPDIATPRPLNIARRAVPSPVGRHRPASLVALAARPARLGVSTAMAQATETARAGRLAVSGRAGQSNQVVGAEAALAMQRADDALLVLDAEDAALHPAAPPRRIRPSLPAVPDTDIGPEPERCQPGIPTSSVSA